MGATLEFLILRDVCAEQCGPDEGFTLGRIYADGSYLGYTLEDEDRHLENGEAKIYGKTAMPLGRYRLELYNSPKHGLVPLFKDVPQFTYTEIHAANEAKELLGCVAVGQNRTKTGVSGCRPVLDRILFLMKQAQADGRECFCTISRV